ncbi:hypothetical protein DDB_G0268844 [Dictyostelium discoideum AX4]|uniref:Uncharacterized protein n=1 Tax=Dictyostelium discoideum TaxID=44689 RepID=Q55EK8_DICDI|nr:hypothetical protein DDB_G0268844 [Dictyostelium discoideum AX4]EAL73011.1 hypothetical protein DDB_G0268844 [Dictyostelium discoideum AX4]|eukprot:XP_647012.1 hypothetical protein DDB_G0268844 [Dictyostelium discoideum AX4]
MKYISFFVTLILISILNNFVLSSGTTVSEVTLIVNLNNNNNYPENGTCGSTQLTCNNINDAFNYFNTIAVNVNTSSQIIYQQLNLLLDDGTYSIGTTTINLYQYNITISPLNSGSNKVIINNNNNSPMFSVIPFNSTDDSIWQNSYILITGIQFLNFKQSIIKVSTIYSFTDIKFQSCIINQYNSKSSIIEINLSFQGSLQIPNSHLKINNSQISNIQTDNNTPLIFAINTIIDFNQNSITNATGIHSFISTSYGEYLNVDFSDFTNVNSSYGIFEVTNTHASIGDGNYNNIQATRGASVLTFTKSVTQVYSAAIARCNFNGYSGTNGGVFQGLNTLTSLETISSSISQCTFSSGSSNSGGAIYSNNIPLSIVNCDFGNNSASLTGGYIYISGNSLSLVNVSITKAPLPITTTTNTIVGDGIGGYALYALNSTVNINNGTFGGKLDSIFCNGSTINADQYTTLQSVYCSNCNVEVSNRQVCNFGGDSTSTSTSNSGTGTGTGTGGGISISSSSGGASQTLTITSTSSTPQTSALTSSSSSGSVHTTVSTITTTGFTSQSNQFSPSFSIFIFILLLLILSVQ